MVLSYATIICQLNVLKLERRRLTNFSSHSYRGKYYSGHASYKKGVNKDSVTEVLTRQQLEKGDSYVPVTYSHSSEEAEKQICETLQKELANEMTTEMMKPEEKLRQNKQEICFETKRCSSLREVGHKNNRKRRFSELDGLLKVNI